MNTKPPDEGILSSLKGWFHPTQALLLYSVLVAIRLWSLYAVPEHSSWIQLNRFALVSIIGMTAYFVLVGKRTEIPRSFGWNVGVFLGCQILTIIPAWYVHDQPPLMTFTGTLFIYFWLTYFLLHYFRIPPRRIVLTILAIGLVWALINIIQQFTYPKFLFFSRLNYEGGIELRAGVRRFMIFGWLFGALSLFYLFNQILHKGKPRHWLGFLVMATGVHYYGTRQITFTSIFVIFLICIQYIYYKKYRFTPQILALGLSFVIIASLLAEPLLGKMIDMTTSAPNNGTDYRAMSYAWYGLEYWNHWMCYILGNGLADPRSAFGQEVMSFQARGMYQVDIGIVGAWSMYGIIFVIGVIATFIRAILVPQSEGTIFIRAMFLLALFNLSVSTFYPEAEAYTFYSFLFYLLDHRLNEDRVAKESQFKPFDNTSLTPIRSTPWYSARKNVA